MAEQRLHSQLAPIDLLTRLELQQELHKGLDAQVREWVRGLDIARVPAVFAPGTGGTINIIAAGVDDPIIGPQSGDIWMLRRVVVASSAITTDTARYILFRGTTPSDVANAYSNRNLLEGFTAVVNNTPASPALGASPFTYINANAYGVNVAIAGGTVSAVAVNGQSTGSTSGSFYLAPNSYITVTYSAAPTFVVTGANSTGGQAVGMGYYPGNKAVYLQPGEQIYAQVYNTTAGNTYTMNGEAIRCPAEMKGKVL
jgi:hypothetical protein